MIDTQALLEKYSAYTDQELFDLHADIHNYSKEAKTAFDQIIAQKGGIEKFLEAKTLNDARILARERVMAEVRRLATPGVDATFLKRIITSEALSRQELDETIDEAFVGISKEVKDVQTTPKTISRSLIGGTVASFLGAIFFALQLILSARLFLLLVVGVVILCYGVISAITGQSKRNSVVLVTTILSSVVSYILGYLIFSVVGFRG